MAELRKQVGVIFQNYIRYQISVSKNIAVGNIEDKENRALLMHAAKQSLADLLVYGKLRMSGKL